MRKKWTVRSLALTSALADHAASFIIFIVAVQSSDFFSIGSLITLMDKRVPLLAICARVT